ncbi:tyrosine-type recombinase/integrase [Cohaesibacter marisflavi]|nr:tyrosine-type recombinase/integrase [Cohaesibacter marisflavi]
MRKIEDKFGTMPLAALEDRRVKSIFLDWRDETARRAPREADNRLATLQAVLSWSYDRGLIEKNPLESFERVYNSDRADKIWLPSDIERFMSKASIGLQRALILALHTGQRQGDLLKLSWSNYDGQYIRLRQGKGNVLVEIPCTKALRAMLDNMPREAATVLLSASGQPWKSKNFQHRWKDAMVAAKIEDLHFHDLRGTAVTMLAEAGCTAPQIAAITGHSLRHVSGILDKYLAKTRTLADQAMSKFENAQGTEFANQLQTKAQ